MSTITASGLRDCVAAAALTAAAIDPEAAGEFVALAYRTSQEDLGELDHERAEEIRYAREYGGPDDLAMARSMHLPELRRLDARVEGLAVLLDAVDPDAFAFIDPASFDLADIPF